MTFLSPTIAIIVGATGLAGLLLLYVLKLLRRPLRVSSTRFWPIARDETQVNAPWRAFRPSWLFVLHLLLLAAAVFALARPAVVSDAPAGDRVVIILDTSASMGCVDVGQSTNRLERAQGRADEIAAEVLRDPAHSVCIIHVAAEAKVASGFTRSRSVAKVAIDGARVTHQPADIASALELAGLLLGNDERSRGAIVLLSDGAFHHATAPTLNAPAPLKFERVGYAQAPPANVGVTEFSVVRDAQQPTLLRVFARVTMNQAAPQSIAYTLAVDGEPVDSGTLRSEQTGEIRDVPLSLQTRVDRSAVISLTIPIDDALAADNAAHAVIGAPPAPRIALVTANEDSSPAAAGSFIFDVLSELPAVNITKLTRAEFEALTDIKSRFDLVVLDVEAPMAAPPLPTLSFGALDVPGVVRVETGSTGATTASIWDRTSPVFDGITIDALAADKRHAFKITDASRARSIAQASIGSIAVYFSDQDITRIALAFTLERSNFPLLPEFPIFIANCIDVLTARAARSQGASWTTDQVLNLTAVNEGTIALVGDAPFTHRVDRAGRVNLPRVPNVGLYETEGCEERFVAINMLDRTETELQAPMTIEFNGLDTAFKEPGASVRELTPLALGALLALLFVEWFVFGLRTRI